MLSLNCNPSRNSFLYNLFRKSVDTANVEIPDKRCWEEDYRDGNR